jgi:hypothetical protein
MDALAENAFPIQKIEIPISNSGLSRNGFRKIPIHGGSPPFQRTAGAFAHVRQVVGLSAAAQLRARTPDKENIKNSV